MPEKINETKVALSSLSLSVCTFSDNPLYSGLKKDYSKMKSTKKHDSIAWRISESHPGFIGSLRLVRQVSVEPAVLSSFHSKIKTTFQRRMLRSQIIKMHWLIQHCHFYKETKETKRLSYFTWMLGSFWLMCQTHFCSNVLDIGQKVLYHSFFQALHRIQTSSSVSDSFVTDTYPTHVAQSWQQLSWWFVHFLSPLWQN